MASRAFPSLHVMRQHVEVATSVGEQAWVFVGAGGREERVVLNLGQPPERLAAQHLRDGGGRDADVVRHGVDRAASVRQQRRAVGEEVDRRIGDESVTLARPPRKHQRRKRCARAARAQGVAEGDDARRRRLAHAAGRPQPRVGAFLFLFFAPSAGF